MELHVTDMSQPAALRMAAVETMRENGFVPVFPPEVLQEVMSIDARAPERVDGVRDLRDLLWSSVDNRESRDLDQVEVAELVARGAIRLRIGIADVDAMVPPGSAADEHAAVNTTSVYTGVVVFPMLPERLSNDLTSLNEGEDRLAYVVEFDIERDGSVEHVDVYRALLRNHAKLTYERIGAWLAGTGQPPREFERVPGLEAQLRLQADAAQRLRESRIRDGALNIETIEARPVVVKGRVVDLAITQRNPGRDLIEDYMVAANRAVAQFLVKNGAASIRRIVRQPKRWDRLVALAAEVGEVLPVEPDNVALGSFLSRRKAADPDHFQDLSLSVVKLLGPGEYTIERRMGDRRNTGHFGLGVADYVHSTAPNRRFVDLITQRLLKAVMAGTGAPYSDDALIEIARRCTDREDAARKVERTMRKVAAATLFASRVGESFTAIITGASPKGVYARVLSVPIEGRVVRGGGALDVGATVRLTLIGTNPDKGHIDFAYEEGEATRKLERTRRKKAAAERLRTRVGETFQGRVTGASPKGVYVRLVEEDAEGRVVRGYKGLEVGMTVPVTLVATDTVHGFIDFEHGEGITAPKQARRERKREAARALEDRIGEEFNAVVTGISGKATWLRLDNGTEGRLVRGAHGLAVGDAFTARLLTADPVRGFIDFARDDSPYSD